MLEKFTIENGESTYSSTLLSFISQHRNLHTLSLKHCDLSSIAFIHFLQFSSNRLSLHKLTSDDCAIQIPYASKYYRSVAISYRIESISPTDGGNFSLEITGSLYTTNYIMSQPDLFYANTLTVLMVTIESGTTGTLQTYYVFPNLVTLKILSKSEKNTACLHSFPFSSHNKNLHTLSLTIKMSPQQ